MTTGLERIAAKARCEPKLRFTSLAHHITEERVWESLCHIPAYSAPGVDGQTTAEAKESFSAWIEPLLEAVHRQGYQAPAIRRVYIPKPGKQEKRPLGVPCIRDRAPQRIRAHAAICFIALVLHRILRQRLQAHHTGISPTRCLETLRRIQHHRVHLPQQTLTGVSTLTPQQEALFAALNLPAPTRTRLEALV